MKRGSIAASPESACICSGSEGRRPARPWTAFSPPPGPTRTATRSMPPGWIRSIMQKSASSGTMHLADGVERLPQRAAAVGDVGDPVQHLEAPGRVAGPREGDRQQGHSRRQQNPENRDCDAVQAFLRLVFL